MLGAHERIAIPFESHLYNTFYPWLPYYGDLGEAANRERLVSDILKTEVMRDWSPRPDRARVLAAVERHDFHGIVAAILRSWTHDVGKRRWGEKTPPHAFWWRPILEGFPTMKAIHIVRDGRDVALSWKRARFGPKHVYLLAQGWVRYLKVVDELRAALPGEQFFELRYEELLRAPDVVLDQVCRFLGEDYSDEMLLFYRHGGSYRTDQANIENLRKPVLRDNTAKWEREMTPHQLRVFEAVAGPMLRRFGYQPRLTDPKMTDLERFRIRYLVHPPRKALAMLKNRKGHIDGIRRLAIYLRLRLNRPRP
jgi:hypothetical protein